MRFICLVLIVCFLAGCNDAVPVIPTPTLNPGATSVPIAPPTLPPTLISVPTQKPITFAGDQNQNTAPFELDDGAYELAWALDLRDENQTLFQLWFKSTDGSRSDLLINNMVLKSGALSGSTYVYNVSRGQYYLSVGVSSAAYTVMVTKR